MCWGSRFTDIAFLSLKPVNPLAEQYKSESMLQLNLLPPRVGERIVGFGYAGSAAERLDGGRIQLALHPITTLGPVTEVYCEYRDKGMLKFPCFEINTHFAGGMSGGPLFNEAGEVCGLICSSQNGVAIAYGATLWPAMGTVITHQMEGMVYRHPYPVFELAQIGLVAASGWDKIAQRIDLQVGPLGEELLRLKPD